MDQDVLSLLRPNEARRRNASFAGLSSLLAGSTALPKPMEEIGGELHHLIDALAQSGRELHGISDATLAAHVKQALDHIAAISCRIAVVGQVKAGKSSFINALMQRGELLPTHVNPWTAVATKLHFGAPGKPVTGCDFTFFSEEEWAALGRSEIDEDDGSAEMKSRAEVRLGEQFHHLLGRSHFYQSVQAGILENYLCAGPPVDEISRAIKPGRYADITKSANVYFPLPPLAVPAILIDTPGTNNSTHLRHRITREIIEGADIYIVVLTARQPLASSDIGLLKLLKVLEKKRIIVFINRVDELNERAGAVDLVVKHVKDELERVFQGASIPVIAGSAKWAGLATTEDAKLLHDEAQTPSFKAVAAQRALSVSSGGGQDDDLAHLQECFRTASGLSSITKLLSMFMLSGFVSNHAKGIANVLLSAADVSAATARQELHAIAGQLEDMQRKAAAADGTGIDGLNAYVAEIRKLLAQTDRCIDALKAESGLMVTDGIARLETALDSHIHRFAEPQRQASTGTGAAKDQRTSAAAAAQASA